MSQKEGTAPPTRVGFAVDESDDEDDPDALFFNLGAEGAGQHASSPAGARGGGESDTDSDDNDDEFEAYDLPDDSANPNVAKVRRKTLALVYLV